MGCLAVLPCAPSHRRTTHVIYPALQDLKVGLKMARPTYRPGETASAEFSVKSPKESLSKARVAVRRHRSGLSGVL